MNNIVIFYFLFGSFKLSLIFLTSVSACPMFCSGLIFPEPLTIFNVPKTHGPSRPYQYIS